MLRFVLALAAAPTLACTPIPAPNWPAYVADLDGFARAIAEAVHTPDPILLGVVEDVRLTATHPARPPYGDGVLDTCGGDGSVPEKYDYALTLRAWDGATNASRVTRSARSYTSLDRLRGRYIIALGGGEDITLLSDWPEPSPAQIVAINRCIQQRRCTEAEIATLGR